METYTKNKLQEPTKEVLVIDQPNAQILVS